RSASLKDVPLRMRSASNPGGRGHAWVKERFIGEGSRLGEGSGFRVQGSENAGLSDLNPEPRTLNPLPDDVFCKYGRLYVPSRIADNPHLDGEEYRQSLLHLPPVERERLMNGDWSVQEKTLIDREWLRYFVEVSEQLELMEPDGRCVATIPEGECYRFMTV